MLDFKKTPCPTVLNEEIRCLHASICSQAQAGFKKMGGRKSRWTVPLKSLFTEECFRLQVPFFVHFDQFDGLETVGHVEADVDPDPGLLVRQLDDRDTRLVQHLHTTTKY